MSGRHALSGHHTICDSDIPYIVFWEKDFDITACFDIVSPQPGQSLGNHASNFSSFSNHTLKRRTVEIAVRLAVVHTVFMLEYAVFLSIIFEHGFLQTAHTPAVQWSIKGFPHNLAARELPCYDKMRLFTAILFLLYFT